MSVYTTGGFPTRVSDEGEAIPTYYSIVYHWPDAIDTGCVRLQRKFWQREHDELRAAQKKVNVEAARVYRAASKDALRMKNACDIILEWIETGSPPMRWWPVELAAELDRVLGICEVRT